MKKLFLIALMSWCAVFSSANANTPSDDVKVLKLNRLSVYEDSGLHFNSFSYISELSLSNDEVGLLSKKLMSKYGVKSVNYDFDLNMLVVVTLANITPDLVKIILQDQFTVVIDEDAEEGVLEKYDF